MPKTHSNASRFEAFLSNTVLANSGCLLWKSAMHRTDMWSKGRHVRGEAVENAKLTDAIVIECRERYRSGDVGFHKLAKEFGVCKKTMMRAIKGQQWKHIPMV